MEKYKYFIDKLLQIPDEQWGISFDDTKKDILGLLGATGNDWNDDCESLCDLFAYSGGAYFLVSVNDGHGIYWTKFGHTPKQRILNLLTEALTREHYNEESNAA